MKITGGAVAHSATTGRTVDDHHDEDHAASGATHTGTISAAQHAAMAAIVGAHGHDDLDTVGTDDHHAQSHALDSHSSFSHDVLTGVSASDHIGLPSQANMEDESAIGFQMLPSRLRFAPSAAKVHVAITSAGASSGSPYNVASITDTGVGDRTIVVDNDFSSAANQGWTASLEGNTDLLRHGFSAHAVGSVRHTIWNDTPALTDQASFSVAFGDQ